MKRGAIVALATISCAHDPPIVGVRAPARIESPAPVTPVVRHAHRSVFALQSYSSSSNWRCGTAELPGRMPFDPVADEQPIDSPPVHRSVQSYPGQRALNDDLERTTAAIRDCYTRADQAHLAVPRMAFTIEEQPHPPVLITSVTPRDAPLALTVCVADVFRRELVGPFGSEGPMTITTMATSLP